MEILIMFISWTVITFLFSLKDRTSSDVRFRFTFMMVCCSIISYIVYIK